MKESSRASDVVRTLIVCVTIGVVGYLGFRTLSAALQRPPPSETAADPNAIAHLEEAVQGISTQLESLSAQREAEREPVIDADAVARMEKAIAGVESQLETLSELIEKPTTADTERETWNRCLKIYRLVARYNEAGDSVHVSGKVRCEGGTWTAVEIALIFRGYHNVINHREHFTIAEVTEKTPFDRGMVHEFAFEIPRFTNTWEEDNVTAHIHKAVALHGP